MTDEKKCPFGHTFGKDVDQYEDCDTCEDFWEDCLEEYYCLKREEKAAEVVEDLVACAPVQPRFLYDWTDKQPEHPGHFYYDGPLPGPNGERLGIVEVFRNPFMENELFAYVFIPPHTKETTKQEAEEHGSGSFAGGKEIINGKMIVDKLENWTGRWAGPPHGLLYVDLAQCQMCKELNRIQGLSTNQNEDNPYVDD